MATKDSSKLVYGGVYVQRLIDRDANDNTDIATQKKRRWWPPKK